MSQNIKPTVHNYREFKDYPKIVAAVSRILGRQRFVAPVELLVEMGLLTPANLERWKRGQVPCLERVIHCNLTRAGRILRLLSFHAHDLKLKPSVTVYQHRRHRLQFSRSGAPLIEEAYARHFGVVGKCNPFAAPALPETQPVKEERSARGEEECMPDPPTREDRQIESAVDD